MEMLQSGCLLEVRGHLSLCPRESPSCCNGSTQTCTSQITGAVRVDWISPGWWDRIQHAPVPWIQTPSWNLVCLTPSLPYSLRCYMWGFPAPCCGPCRTLCTGGPVQAFLPVPLTPTLLQNSLQHFHNSLCWQSAHSAEAGGA